MSRSNDVDSTKPETQSSTDQVPPAVIVVPVAPDGGFQAWLQVAGSFCIFLNTWSVSFCRFPRAFLSDSERGVVNMYGVFQTYYSHDIAETSSSSDVSWIGSVQGFLLCFIGILIGPIYDLGHSRSLLLTGTCLSLLGIFTTSICKNYWQLFLAQGVTLGLGMGCLFLPGVTVVSQYFSTKKAFATGIASLGAGIGMYFLPI